ncbi:nuclear transport factor 2 family protein [Hyphococcus luteus]|uniref:nuclear transport factor 2 family protein n=1 Tax=Hyphococcus luteus TaxID=2058213 RepID=UPI0013FD8538|nr:nuclear transport factor 2 family protein [Marinicaulis flavus]
MTFKLADYEFGSLRTPEELAIIRACEETFIAFCDFMDMGEVEKAMSLHVEDVVLYDAGRSEPMTGRALMLERMKKVRFSYPGRRTLHTPTNFRFHQVNGSEAECRVVISLYDLVKMPEGKGIGRYSTELLGYAAEEVRFVPENGFWRFHTRKVQFLAGMKQLPNGTMPGDLPWNE